MQPTATEPVAARTDPRRSLSAVGEIALIVAVVLIPLGWRALAGDDLPAGDAWAYERIARSFHETGQIMFVDWNDITLVGMIPVTALWTALTGFSLTSLHVLGSVMAAVALIGVRTMLVDLGVTRRWFPLLLIGACWGLPGVTGTYLSDTFAFAGAIWAVALAVRLVVRAPQSRRTRWGCVIGAAVAGAYGISVRQQAATGLLAAAVVLWTDRRTGRPTFGVFAVAATVLIVPLLWWRGSLEHSGGVLTLFEPRMTLAGLTYMAFGIGILAFTTAIGRQGAGPMSVRWAAVVPAAIALVTAMIASAGAQHDLVDVLGLMWDRAGTLWFVAAITALFCLAVIGWWNLVKGAPAPPAGLRWAILVALAAEAGSVVLTGNYFSRYSLLSGALVAVALSVPVPEPTTVAATATAPGRRSFTRQLAGGCALIGLLAGAALYEVDVSIALRGALRDAAAVGACLGIGPDHLDGGFDWNGKHYTGIADPQQPPPTPDGLPENGQRRPFPDLVRSGVFVAALPSDMTALIAAGPFESSGITPGTAHRGWLVMRSDEVSQADADRCQQSILGR